MENGKRLIFDSEFKLRLNAVIENRKRMGLPYDQLENVALGLLDCCPTVDAVEVVRCKDCKHWNKRYETKGLCMNHSHGFVLHQTMATCQICKYAGNAKNKPPCADCRGYSKYEYEKPLTNADRIRAMSDEELASFILNLFAESMDMNGIEHEEITLADEREVL